MNEGIIAVAISSVFTLLVAIVSAIAMRMSKKQEIRQVEATNALDAIAKHSDILSQDLTRVNTELTAERAYTKQLREEVKRRDETIDKIGQRRSDKLASASNKVSVLLVEDENNDAFITTTIISQNDCIGHISRVTRAADAREVKTDVIVTDLNLGPSSNGVDTLVALRKMHPITPIIVLTASDDLGDRCRALGAVGYVTKPSQLADQKLAELIIAVRAMRVAPLEE